MPGLLRRGRRVLSAGLGWLTRRKRRWLARLPELPLLRWAAGFRGRDAASTLAATAFSFSAAAFALAAFAFAATTKSASSAAIAAASGLCLLLAVQQLLPTRLVLLQPLAMLCEPAVVAGCVLLGDAVTAAVTATASAIAAATTVTTTAVAIAATTATSNTRQPSERGMLGRLRQPAGCVPQLLRIGWRVLPARLAGRANRVRKRLARLPFQPLLRCYDAIRVAAAIATTATASAAAPAATHSMPASDAAASTVAAAAATLAASSPACRAGQQSQPGVLGRLRRPAGCVPRLLRRGWRVLPPRVARCADHVRRRLARLPFQPLLHRDDAIRVATAIATAAIAAAVSSAATAVAIAAATDAQATAFAARHDHTAAAATITTTAVAIASTATAATSNPSQQSQPGVLGRLRRAAGCLPRLLRRGWRVLPPRVGRCTDRVRWWLAWLPEQPLLRGTDANSVAAAIAAAAASRADSASDASAATAASVAAATAATAARINCQPPQRAVLGRLQRAAGRLPRLLRPRWRVLPAGVVRIAKRVRERRVGLREYALLHRAGGECVVGAISDSRLKKQQRLITTALKRQGPPYSGNFRRKQTSPVHPTFSFPDTSRCRRHLLPVQPLAPVPPSR